MNANAIVITGMLASIITTTYCTAAVLNQPQPMIPTVDFKIVEQVQEEQEETYFDVPLSEEIQDCIFEECEKKNIKPEMVVSIIERESQFDEKCVGDSGRSKGLMQIQERWHSERMQQLDCSDLMDAKQNIIVGIDYLAELQERNPDETWILMAYNGGASYANKMVKQGKCSSYAEEVLKNMEKKGCEVNGFSADF